MMMGNRLIFRVVIKSNAANGVCKIAWVPTGENIADAMAKRLSVTVRERLFGQWTY